MATFKQLVRFAVGDQAHYGELINIDGNEYTVQQFDGTPFDKLLSTDKIHTVTDVCFAGLVTTFTKLTMKQSISFYHPSQVLHWLSVLDSTIMNTPRRPA